MRFAVREGKSKFSALDAFLIWRQKLKQRLSKSVHVSRAPERRVLIIIEHPMIAAVDDGKFERTPVFGRLGAADSLCRRRVDIVRDGDRITGDGFEKPARQTDAFCRDGEIIRKIGILHESLVIEVGNFDKDEKNLVISELCYLKTRFVRDRLKSFPLIIYVRRHAITAIMQFLKGIVQPIFLHRFSPIRNKKHPESEMLFCFFKSLFSVLKLLEKLRVPARQRQQATVDKQIFNVRARL